ncbi:MAG TPA: DUF1631 family protein [Oxalicibacterium sp.]|nr:DUF1631 family protein [Oxalicibacterium sp.]
MSPVVQLAKERALFRFSTLAVRMLQDANQSIAQLIPAASTAQEQKSIALAREFLQEYGKEFLKRLNESYAAYVERGMQTMYRDLRQSMHDISSDSLTLVEDDTVIKQIEVERRVLRLRDADQQSLGRLNLMIAQIHGEHDVRERENPFRPYLMARALHDVLCSMTTDSNVCAMLFDHLSGALCNHLPEYFAAIRDVFESHGVHAQLLARPSALSRRDREALAAPNMLLGGAHSALDGAIAAPALERILSLVDRRKPEGGAMPVLQPDSWATLQDFVWKILNQSSAPRMPSRQTEGQAAPQQEAATHPLLERLQQLQQRVLQAEGTENALDLQAELGLQDASDGHLPGGSPTDRIAVDVVTVLFGFIAADQTLPPGFRAQILRLQAPFLKAAVVDPAVLQSPGHPFRLLLNRLAALPLGFDESAAPGNALLAAATQAVEHLLRDFRNDASLIETVRSELDIAVAALLRGCDAETAKAADALAAAAKNPEQFDTVLANITAALRERLATLQTDPRAVDFITGTWSRVVAHVSQHPEIDSKPYLDAIPELIWSVQNNLDAGERGALMRLLPKLAARLREGLALIHMPESATRPVLDGLMEMHAQVLRATPDPLQYSMRLGSLIQHFAGLKIGSIDNAVVALHAPTISPERLRASLRQFRVKALTWVDGDIGSLTSEDARWLGSMQAGTAIEWWSENEYSPAVLMWVDDAQSFYLFRIDPARVAEGDPNLLIYSSISLIRALREGSVGLREPAPVFERAIESLLRDDGAAQQPVEDVA